MNMYASASKPTNVRGNGKTKCVMRSFAIVLYFSHRLALRFSHGSYRRCFPTLSLDRIPIHGIHTFITLPRPRTHTPTYDEYDALYSICIHFHLLYLISFFCLSILSSPLCSEFSFWFALRLLQVCCRVVTISIQLLA